MNKVSIIIPVYNGEKYTARCLDSIINNSYKNIEIIVINDGSNDNTLEILNKFNIIDDRLIIINKKNEGVSSARNDGLKKASGNLIMFIDIDDFISKDYIKNMVAAYEKENIDIIVSGYTTVKNNKYNHIKLLSESRVINFSESDLIENSIYSSVWGKLFKKDVLLKSFFNKELNYVEDWLFMFDSLKSYNKVYYLNDFGYFYFINDGSAMHNYSIDKINKYYLDNMFVLDYIDNVSSNKYSSKIFQRRFTKINYTLIKLCYIKDMSYKRFKSLIGKYCNDISLSSINLKELKYESTINRIRLFLLKNKFYRLYFLLNRLAMNK